MTGTMSQFSPPGISNAAQRSLKTFRMLYLPIDHTRERSCNATPGKRLTPHEYHRVTEEGLDDPVNQVFMRNGTLYACGSERWGKMIVWILAVAVVRQKSLQLTSHLAETAERLLLLHVIGD
jgi:hypothetical protein